MAQPATLNASGFAMRRTSLRHTAVAITWLAVLTMALQSAFTVQAQSTEPGELTNAGSLPINGTLDVVPIVDSSTPLTLTSAITLSAPITFAPLPSVSLPMPPIITTSLTQVVTMTAPDVRQADVVAKMEPPKTQGKQEAVHVPAVSGDVVHPPKWGEVPPTTQPLYVLLDWGKLKQGQSVQVKLDLQVITPTASPIDIILTLPAGLTYDGKSSKRAVYDATARTLTFFNVDTHAKKLLSDAFRIDINVPTAPALLQTVVDWHTVDGAQHNTQIFPLSIGARHASDVLTRKAGGVFQATKRVKLTFPAGSLKADMAVSSAEYAVVTQSVTAGDALYTANILPFEFGPDMPFDVPVSVTVDANDLFSADLLSATGRLPVLQYVSSEVITPAMREDGTPITTTVVRLEDIPSSYDAASGLLTAQITHFSTYQVTLQQPVNPQVWKLTANAAHVSLFRGALNYAYPIQTPAMVDGLQPNLSLNYSSAAADSGFDQQYQPGEWLSMGKGWSLEVPNITRSVNRSYFCDGGSSTPPPVCYGRVSYEAPYANDFTLSLGGKAYNLIAKGGGEFVPEDYAPIRARLCNDLYPCSGALSIPGTNADGTYAGNTTGEYWQVWTPDGTRWLFGIDAQTENKVYAYNYYWPGHYELPYNPSWNPYGGYAGRAEGVIARAWFLRRAYAPARDNINNGLWSVQWLYETGSNTITPPFTNSSLSQPDDWVRPIKVVYGPSLRPDGNAATQRWLVQFEYWGGAAWPRLNNLYVGMGDANGNAWRWLRRYELGTTSGQPLDGVLEYAINASGYWQSGLPKTTFGYIVLPHNNNLAPPLLNHIENGYGATWDYDYVGDPNINSYWVTTATNKSYVNNAVVWTGMTVYDYGGYPNGIYCTATSSNANLCVNPAHVLNGAYPNNLVGFAKVIEKVIDPSNLSNTLAKTEHNFYYNNLHRLGREWQTRSFDGAGTPISAQTTEFYDWPDATGAHGLPSGAWFVATKVVNTFPFGDVNTSPYKRVVYDYDDNFNNGWSQRWLVGANLTRKVDWGFVCGGTTCDGDEVTTRYGYTPNTATDKWIVGKLAWENLYAGADEANEWPADFRTQTFLYYDGATSYTTPPVRGQLTQVGAGNSSIAAQWTTQQIGYDAVGNINALTDGRGNTTNAGYDASGWFMMWAQTPANDAGTRLTTVYRYYGVDESGCAGGTGTFAGFGPYGALKCSIDPNGVATASYSYDLFGRLRKIASPGDTFAQPTEEYFYSDANSPFFVQRFVRRASGVGINPDDGGWSNPEGYGGWWVDGYWTPNLSAIGTWERTFYDGLGRTIETQTPMADWAYGGQMTVAWTNYDAFGRTWQGSVPYAETFSGTWYRNANTGAARTTTAYDALSRVTSVTGPDGALTRKIYGNEANLMRERSVDANNHTRVQATDGLGRLRKTEEYSATYPSQILYATTNYVYDTLGNLTGVTDAAGNVTSISYDALGRKTSMSDPDMGTWQYQYDANGNLTQQTDAKGQVLTFAYDALNRLTRKSVNGTQVAGYVYDEAGWGKSLGKRTLAQVYTNGAPSATWTRFNYDSRGRIDLTRTSIDGAVYETWNAYDAADRVNGMYYPNGEWVEPRYDPAGHASQLYGWTSQTGYYPYVVDTTFNAAGQPVLQTYGNGVYLSNSYDTATFRLTERAVGVGDNADSWPLWQRWGYDAVGNVSWTQDFRDNSRLNPPPFAYHQIDYTYDELDRLRRAQTIANSTSQPNIDESYTYDPSGNLKSKSTVGSYTYDAHPNDVPSERVIPHAVHLAGSNSYTYDLNGNNTRRSEGGVVWVQVWDAENQLTQVYNQNNPAQSSQFFYDADGQRVKKIENGVTTIYIGDHFERNLSTGEYTHYYVLNGQRVALRRSVDWTRGSGTVTYLHSDLLGSTSLATNAGGVVVSNLRYTPFGTVRWTSGTLASDKKFTGQREESMLGGLYDYGARFYDPLLGRFLSPDTIVPNAADPQNLNRYSYGYNSPLKYTDPTGHRACNNQDDCSESGETPHWRSRAPVAGVTIPGWSTAYANATGPDQRQRAEAAFNHFVRNPDAFLQMYVDPDIWNASDAVADLDWYAQYSELHTTARALVSGYAANSYGSDAWLAINDAQTQNTYIRDPAQKIHLAAITVGGVALVALGHGNLLASGRLTYLYQLVEVDEAGNFVQHLKYGITSEGLPIDRYTRAFMRNKRMYILDWGTRVDMANRERALTEEYGGPLNYEPWSASRK